MQSTALVLFSFLVNISTSGTAGKYLRGTSTSTYTTKAVAEMDTDMLSHSMSEDGISSTTLYQVASLSTQILL